MSIWLILLIILGAIIVSPLLVWAYSFIFASAVLHAIEQFLFSQTLKTDKNEREKK
jgi:hypothetical protein